MSNKVVMLMADAVNFQTGVEVAGAIEGWVEAGQARRFEMRSVLPSLSRPAYETLHTGTTPQEHGIHSNEQIVSSKGPHVFGLARAAGKVSAAVAQYYFAELNVRAPYDPVRDCEFDDESLDIQHGRFYEETGHNDSNSCLHGIYDICARGTNLMNRFAPDYLFLHCIGPDHVGHVEGAASQEYCREIWNVSDALAHYAPRWRAAGYRVIVTADHGMSDDGRHGGTTEQERHVPFWDIGHPRGGVHEAVVEQTSVAPTLLDILGIAAPATMKAPSLANA